MNILKVVCVVFGLGCREVMVDDDLSVFVSEALVMRSCD